MNLNFTAKEDNCKLSYVYEKEASGKFFWSEDDKTWNEWMPEEELVLNKGDKVFVKGDNPKGFSIDFRNIMRFCMEGHFDAAGNVNSLLSEDFKDEDKLPEFAFCGLFKNCSGLASAPELPSTNLSSYCYAEMFAHYPLMGVAKLNDCDNVRTYTDEEINKIASLEEAPQLPAKKLAQGCYNNMFGGCQRLKKCPELPATELAESCYSNMFTDCNSIEETPDLPATKLAKSCYRYMFQHCNALKKVTNLPKGEVADNCYQDMFLDCYALENAPSFDEPAKEDGAAKERLYKCRVDSDGNPTDDWTDYCYEVNVKLEKPLPDNSIFYVDSVSIACEKKINVTLVGNIEGEGCDVDGSNYTTGAVASEIHVNFEDELYGGPIDELKSLIGKPSKIEICPVYAPNFDIEEGFDIKGKMSVKIKCVDDLSKSIELKDFDVTL